MIDILLPLGLAFIMAAIGLGLRVEDFTRVARQPRALGGGLVNQLVLLPLLGAGLVSLFPGRPEFALGLMVLAACPGGITSNLLTMLAGGNAALSVSMTAIASLAGIVTVPLILGVSQGVLFGDGEMVALPLNQILGGVFGVTGVPIALGMGIHHRWPRLAAAVRPVARRLATVIFAIIVVGAFLGQRETMMAHALDLGPYVLALNVGTMALGMITAQVLRLDWADAVAVTMEAGLQNAALAIFIATTLLGMPDMVVPAILYAFVMNITAAAFIAGARARARGRAGERPGAEAARGS